MNTTPFVRPRWGPRACIDAALGLVLAADVAPDKAETMGWPVYRFTRLPGHTRLITQIVVVFLGSCKLLFRSESDVTSYRVLPFSKCWWFVQRHTQHGGIHWMSRLRLWGCRRHETARDPLRCQSEVGANTNQAQNLVDESLGTRIWPISSWGIRRKYHPLVSFRPAPSFCHRRAAAGPSLPRNQFRTEQPEGQLQARHQSLSLSFIPNVLVTNRAQYGFV